MLVKIRSNGVEDVGVIIIIITTIIIIIIIGVFVCWFNQPNGQSRRQHKDKDRDITNERERNARKMQLLN